MTVASTAGLELPRGGAGVAWNLLPPARLPDRKAARVDQARFRASCAALPVGVAAVLDKYRARCTAQWSFDPPLSSGAAPPPQLRQYLRWANKLDLYFQQADWLPSEHPRMKPRAVYYPNSGPDFGCPHALFPDAALTLTLDQHEGLTAMAPGSYRGMPDPLRLVYPAPPNGGIYFIGPDVQNQATVENALAALLAVPGTRIHSVAQFKLPDENPSYVRARRRGGEVETFEIPHAHLLITFDRGAGPVRHHLHLQTFTDDGPESPVPACRNKPWRPTDWWWKELVEAARPEVAISKGFNSRTFTAFDLTGKKDLKRRLRYELFDTGSWGGYSVGHHTHAECFIPTEQIYGRPVNIAHLNKADRRAYEQAGREVGAKF